MWDPSSVLKRKMLADYIESARVDTTTFQIKAQILRSLEMRSAHLQRTEP